MRSHSFFLLVLLWSTTSLAQTTFKSDLTNSSLTVAGTSTLHDWESVTESFTASAELKDQTLQNVKVSVKVKSIKSGKSGMDSNTYAALKESQFPEIRFSASQLKIDGTRIMGTGSLTIAGSTQTIEVNLSYEQWNTDSYHVIGEIKLKMSDFGISPPTAMMGAIKTGDDISIKLNLAMKQ